MVSSFRVEQKTVGGGKGGVITMTLSLQMAKLESPVVNTVFFKKGERCTVLTSQ